MRVVLAAMLLLAPLAGAAPQDPESVASKQFAQVVQQQLATLKATLKTAEVDTLLGLAGIDVAVKSGVPIPVASVADGLADILDDYQVTVGDALADVYTEVGTQSNALLDGLDAQVGLSNGYPDAFHPGCAGAADVLRDKARKLVEKSTARMRKRALKTRLVVQKALDYRVSVRLEPVRARREHMPNVGVLLFDNNTPLTVDLAVAVSTAADPADALIVLAGQADHNDGDVSLSLTGTDSQVGATATPDTTTQRWSLLLDDTGGLFEEQNAVVRATQGAGGSTVVLAVGLP
jgi:hypothetical protein